MRRRFNNYEHCGIPMIFIIGFGPFGLSDETVCKFWVDKIKATGYNHFRWFQHAGVSELADEADSKSVGGNTVWVQVFCQIQGGRVIF